MFAPTYELWLQQAYNGGHNSVSALSLGHTAWRIVAHQNPYQMVGEPATLNLGEQPLQTHSRDSGFLPHPVLVCAYQFPDQSELGGLSGSIDSWMAMAWFVL